MFLFDSEINWYEQPNRGLSLAVPSNEATLRNTAAYAFHNLEEEKEEEEKLRRSGWATAGCKATYAVHTMTIQQPT